MLLLFFQQQHLLFQPCETSCLASLSLSLYQSFSPACSPDSGSQAPVSHDECGTGPSPGSCHYPMTIYYPLSVGTINPGPGNRDLSVLHYQDLPMSPSLSVTWHTHTYTLTHNSGCVGFQFVLLNTAHFFSHRLITHTHTLFPNLSSFHVSFCSLAHFWLSSRWWAPKTHRRGCVLLCVFMTPPHVADTRCFY